MKVILTAAVPGLGERDDVCDVSPGFARNFLFSKKLATLATPKDLEGWEHRRAERMRHEQDARAASHALAAKLANLTVTLTAKAGPSGQLYGSIAEQEVREAITRAGVHGAEQVQLDLQEPIKKLGDRVIPAVLPWGVRAVVHVRVISEEAP